MAARAPSSRPAPELPLTSRPSPSRFGRSGPTVAPSHASTSYIKAASSFSGWSSAAWTLNDGVSASTGWPIWRSLGPDQPEAYRDWISGLARGGLLAEAEQAAVEALEQLPTHGAGARHARRGPRRTGHRPQRRRAVAGGATGGVAGRGGARCPTAVPARWWCPSCWSTPAPRPTDDRFADTQLPALLDAVDHLGWPFDSTARHELENLAARVGLRSAQAEPFRTVPPRGRALSAGLVDALAAHPPELNRGGGCAWPARSSTGGSRPSSAASTARAYGQAAQLVAGYARGAHPGRRRGAGAGLLHGVHGRYPRHSAFRRKLRTMAAEAPLL